MRVSMCVCQKTLHLTTNEVRDIVAASSKNEHCIDKVGCILVRYVHIVHGN